MTDRPDPRSFVVQLLVQFDYSHEAAETLVQRALDKHAHELAEKLRQEADEWDGWPEKQAVMRIDADLIDPEVTR